MTAKKRYYDWKTRDELNFVAGLGGWGIKPRNRRQLLKSYYAAAENRADWGGIEKETVLSRVWTELEFGGEP